MRLSSDTPSASAGLRGDSVECDRAVCDNIEGAKRRVDAMPGPSFGNRRDVGCDAEFSAMAFVNRVGTPRLTGDDAAEGTLEPFGPRSPSNRC